MSKLSHDSVTRAVFGVSHETVVRRIVATFDRATASDLESGARWYDDARDLAQSLGRTSGHGPDVAACVIAHLSPRTTWARTVAGAVSLLTYGERADGIIGANYARAYRATLTGRPFGTFGPKAPKTLSFARNIAGDDEAVTVDVWACRVASLDETLLGRKGAYDAVAHAYRLAARRRGVSPATMQATTWIVARGGRSS